MSALSSNPPRVGTQGASKLPRRGRAPRLPDEVYHQPFTVYTVTVCAAKRRSLFARPTRARTLVETLLRVANALGVEVGAYCVMPDHVHFALWWRGGGALASLPRFVRAFKAVSTRNLRRMGHRGPVWQRGFFDHLCRREEDVQGVFEYIVANPVRKGLCAEAGGWPHAAIVAYPA